MDGWDGMGWISPDKSISRSPSGDNKHNTNINANTNAV